MEVEVEEGEGDDPSCWGLLAARMTVAAFPGDKLAEGDETWGGGEAVRTCG